MPELPDVEVFRRYLNEHALHRTVARVQVRDSEVLDKVSPQRLGRAMKQRELAATRRHGKYLFVAVGDTWVVLHFGMTGFLEWTPPDAQPAGQARLVWWLDDGAALAYVDQRKLGAVSIADDADAFIEKQRLGPDALAVSGRELAELFASRRSAVKSALMDQSVIAGVGNIYSDEILFQARIHPMGKVGRLGDSERRRLHRQLRRVLRTATDRGADPNRVPRSWLLRHREDGAPCPRGRGRVARLRVGGRGMYYCPTCQPASGSTPTG